MEPESKQEEWTYPHLYDAYQSILKQAELLKGQAEPIEAEFAALKTKYYNASFKGVREFRDLGPSWRSLAYNNREVQLPVTSKSFNNGYCALQHIEEAMKVFSCWREYGERYAQALANAKEILAPVLAKEQKASKSKKRSK